MKKLICFLVLTALLLTALSACKTEKGKDDTSVNSTASSDPNSEYKDDKGKYRSNLEVVDWKGREFKILVRGESAGTYQSEDFTTESTLYGDLLNDAVQSRNDYIEEKYNVKLVVYKSNSIDTDFRNEAIASTGLYDAVMPTLAVCAIYAQENYLYDLSDIENFDIMAPWWDSNATESFSVGGKVFFTTGDITILNKVNTPSILFNKAMISDYGLDNPYELVKNKQWTYDKMIEMAKAVTQINNTDLMSQENTYGMITATGDALLFYGASGEKICSKDANDYPFLSLGKEKSITVAQKILTTMQNGEWCVFAQDYPAPIWDNSFATFHEGRALFRPSAFSATTKARQRSELVFGILPCPLWDDSQEQYYSFCGTSETAGIAIPKSCSDLEFSAYMIEVYAAEAKNTITPAYYEVNIKGRDVRDDESIEMLDIIFDNIVYDVGEVYNFGKVKSMFNTLMSERSTDIMSRLDSIKDAIEIDILKTIANYQAD
ncbi:MAG: hypothetical protein CVU97_06465 [Firmicutes bacterium HGW-Firmicutes-21]|nr:MAG: hypothetical protein CVU97_06465 [Firmicutes bacterium HGW-Firmicutes-21]